MLTLADAAGVALGFVLTLADADGVALGFVLALADADGIALGFALTLVVMGKQKYLPFFVLGFFLYAILGFSMLTGAVIAVCLALIVSLFVQEDSQEVDA